MTAECRIKLIAFIYSLLGINLKNASFGLCLAHCTELLLPTLASCPPAKRGNVCGPGDILSLCHRRDVCRSGDTSRGSSHFSARTESSAEISANTGTHREERQNFTLKVSRDNMVKMLLLRDLVIVHFHY